MFSFTVDVPAEINIHQYFFKNNDWYLKLDYLNFLFFSLFLRNMKIERGAPLSGLPIILAGIVICDNFSYDMHSYKLLNFSHMDVYSVTELWSFYIMITLYFGCWSQPASNSFKWSIVSMLKTFVYIKRTSMQEMKNLWLIVTTRKVKRTITSTNPSVLNITAVTRKTDIVHEVQSDLGIRIYQRWWQWPWPSFSSFEFWLQMISQEPIPSFDYSNICYYFKILQFCNISTKTQTILIIF